jgi:hypothetical protein
MSYCRMGWCATATSSGDWGGALNGTKVGAGEESTLWGIGGGEEDGEGGEEGFTWMWGIWARGIFWVTDGGVGADGVEVM